MYRQAERLNRVVGTVTEARLLPRPIDVVGFPGAVALAMPHPGRLRAFGALRGATMLARIVLAPDGGTREAIALEYSYALEDRLGTEVLAWHHHPRSNIPAPEFPHLHVSASLRPADASGERGLLPLDKRHLPTGAVPLAAFVRMLIEEFGVEPLARDWKARLAEA